LGGVGLAEKEMVLELKNPALLILLIVMVALFVLELQVTLSTPISFGDEGFYARMAQTFGQDLDYPKWMPFRYMELAKRGYSKPPLWSMLNGSFIMIFGFSEAIIKFLTPFIGILIGMAAFFLIKRLFNDKIALIAAIMICTIPSFVTYTVTFYVEMLEVLYTTMFLFLFVIGLKEDKMKYLIVATCFGTLAYFTKKTGILFFAFILIGLVYEILKKKQLFPLLKKYAVLIILPLLLCSSLIFRTYIMYGGFCDVPIFEIPPINSLVSLDCDQFSFQSKYEFAGRTEEVGSENTIWNMGVINYMSFAYGNIWFVVLAAFAGGLIFLYRREPKDMLVLAFLLLYIPIMILSGRGEDAARFALPWASVICLLAAAYYEEAYNFIKSHQRHVAVAIFILVIALGYLNFSDKIGAMVQVKSFYPSFFKACDWIKANTPEGSLVSTLYVYRAGYCSQRRVATINADMALSNNVTYAHEVAKMFGMDYVWINKFAIDPSNRHLSEMIDLSYVQLLEDNSAQNTTALFKKIYEDGPSLGSCSSYWNQNSVCDGNVVYKVV
jgi:4-amino-4-deoxy-L-arabinose transferase-like glycosyltransferase